MAIRRKVETKLAGCCGAGRLTSCHIWRWIWIITPGVCDGRAFWAKIGPCFRLAATQKPGQCHKGSLHDDNWPLPPLFFQRPSSFARPPRRLSLVLSFTLGYRPLLSFKYSTAATPHRIPNYHNTRTIHDARPHSSPAFLASRSPRRQPRPFAAPSPRRTLAEEHVR